MATKNTLFEVDITKENPLITILKHNKIPVLRFGKTGFQNYKQAKYFNKRKEFGIKLHDIIERGCFVHVGGVQGNYISGGHFCEPLNIGYIEPNEKIYSTYNYDKNNDFAFITAKERFEHAKEMYSKYVEDMKVKNYAYEDFDLYSEAIVDSRKIKKVITIYPKDFPIFLKYLEDGFLKIYHEDEIFFGSLKDLPEEFFHHIGFETSEVIDCNPTYYGLYELKTLEDYYENDCFNKVILKEFKHYFSHNSFLKSKEFYSNFRKDFNAFNDYRNVFPKEENCSNLSYFWSDKYLNAYFTYKSIKYNFYLTPEKFEIMKTKEDWKWSDKIKDFITVRNSVDIAKEEMFNNEYRFICYKFLKLYNFYYATFSKYLDISYHPDMEKLNMFYNIETSLNKKYNFSYNNDNRIFIKNDDFELEYDLILKDYILYQNEKYYNLEKLPFVNADVSEIVKVISLYRGRNILPLFY